MQFRRRKVNAAPPQQSGGGQVLALSLFIMLLAFFIVLNAISSFEQTKVRPIMQSLEYAFATKLIDQEAPQPSVTKSPEKAQNEGDTLERLKALFSSQIPGSDPRVNRSRGVMHLTVSYEEFETAVFSIGQAVDASAEQAAGFSGNFLPMLVALLRNDSVGVPYRMDIMLNLPENPAHLQNQDPEQVAMAMRGLSMLAQKLEDAGLAQKLLSVGLQKGKSGTVDLFFRPHIPFNPLGQGEKYDGAE